MYFQRFSDESRSKPNKILVENGSELYNESIKSWLQEICIRHNKGKSVVAERLITTLNKKHDFSFKIYIDS